MLRPLEYARRLAAGESVVAEREVLTESERALEAIMLGVRTRDGLSLAGLSAAGRRAAGEQAALRRVELDGDRARLTVEGRLFATAVARELSA